ncbi:integration host factor subunit alpha [Hydrogenivirga caldilitoris]|uniref:Integration host factor subunit alpha n=1 Tax=Hydrogenivirga caldilitoris TaxID=246264 RepID=A0A497XMX9_9AQUI|nr:HU family DNA-binding protein [Hydrogenivirga caldilitoris]RLJ70275.1 integration host factor subunit alpha [Hydrogenivirga caldilitoris]
MTKKDIANLIHERCEGEFEVTKKEMYQIVSEIFEIIEDTLKRGEKVQVSGFGTFIVKRRKGKVGRNPRTGEEVPVPDRNVIIFKPSKKLLELVELKLKKV